MRVCHRFQRQHDAARPQIKIFCPADRVPGIIGCGAGQHQTALTVFPGSVWTAAEDGTILSWDFKELKVTLAVPIVAQVRAAVTVRRDDLNGWGL